MKLKKLGIVALILLGLFYSGNAWATHAFRLTGSGPRNLAMSGAGVAAPLDSFTIDVNPAGMVHVVNRADFATILGMPQAQMDTSAAPAGNVGAGNQKTEFEIFPMPFIGTVWGFLDNRLALGFAFYQSGGASGTYNQSRFNPAITGNLFDTYIDYRVFNIVPAVAYSILDNFSVGVAIQVGYATFGSDSILPGVLTQTSGRGRTDNAWGLGAKVGFLYSPIPEFSLGVNYTSLMSFQKFGKYNDMLNNNRLNSPHEVKAGIAGRPFENWLLACDFKWINWSGVDVFGDSPDTGGLGWRDQYIVQFGTQVTVIDKIHLRAGFTYGKSPIRNDDVFINALAPVIANYNASAGIGVDITDNWAVDTAFSIAIPKSMTDSGRGGTISASGAGTRVRYTGYAVGLGLSYNWGKKE